jgi:hypothetical protein
LSRSGTEPTEAVCTSAGAERPQSIRSRSKSSRSRSRTTDAVLTVDCQVPGLSGGRSSRPARQARGPWRRRLTLARLCRRAPRPPATASATRGRSSSAGTALSSWPPHWIPKKENPALNIADTLLLLRCAHGHRVRSFALGNPTLCHHRITERLVCNVTVIDVRAIVEYAIDLDCVVWARAINR